MIPHIIHQTWKDENPPSAVKNYISSWKKLHPDYTYMFWTDTDIRDLIENHYPWFLNYFDSYPHQIMRVDAFRFFVLHHYGGIYADLDMEAFKPIDKLLDNPVVLFEEWPGSVSNAIMISEPHHPFLEHCFEELIKNHVTKGSTTAVWEVTGPKFLTGALKRYSGNDYILYNSKYFFPIPWHKPKGDQSGQGHKYPDSYGAHHWQGTWWQPQPTKKWLIWIIVMVLIIIVCGLILLLKSYY